MISEQGLLHPEEGLKEIHQQQAMLKTAVDAQVMLQLMLSKGLVTQEEINDMRYKVSQLPKYKTTLETLDTEEKTMKLAIQDPRGYQSALLKKTMNDLLNSRK